MTMFATKAPQGIAYRQRVAAERRQFLALFADCLAENGTGTACAARLGKGAAWGNAALAQLRRDINTRQRAAGFGDWAV